MKFWNKETRNEAGKFYRRDDWAVEKPEDWDNGKGNFTNQPPPDETLKYGVPCDWIDGAWKLDTDSEQFKNLYAVKRVAGYVEAGATPEALIVGLWEKIIEGNDEPALAIQIKRVAVKEEIPKPK